MIPCPTCGALGDPETHECETLDRYHARQKNPRGEFADEGRRRKRRVWREWDRKRFAADPDYRDDQRAKWRAIKRRHRIAAAHPRRTGEGMGAEDGLS